MFIYQVIKINVLLIFILHSSNGDHERIWLHHINNVRCYKPSFGNISIMMGGSLGQDRLHRIDHYFREMHAPTSTPKTRIARSLTDGESLGPLILTPYIKQKKYKVAIEASNVKPFVAGVESYSGYFEVSRDKYMFFWYFPPISKAYVGKADTPVILWIQGGMGESGVAAALRENGPIRLDPHGKMVFNEWSWAEKAHLVYFDSPVGAGYSFTTARNYSKNQDQIAIDLYISLRQFIHLFGLIKNPFYIAGQAYAGKTVCALGAIVHKLKKSFQINFQGVAIGNGFIDPPEMLGYGKLLYQLGFIDEKVRGEIKNVSDEIKAFLKDHKEEEAINRFTQYLHRDLKNSAPYLHKVTGIVSGLKFTQLNEEIDEHELLEGILNTDSVRHALHTKDVPFTQNNSLLLKAVWPDLLKSQIQNLKLLMNNYRVLLYHGQMSIENSYSLVLDYLRKIRWRDGKSYRLAKREKWKVDEEVAGYFKKGGRFTELLIRKTGCRVAVDQPKWAQRMINNFIFN